MEIPSLHQIEMFVDHPDGQMVNPSYLAAQNQLITQLQKNLSSEGYKVPQQATSTITSLNTMQSVGALLYNSTTHQLMVNIAGTFKVVQVV